MSDDRAEKNKQLELYIFDELYVKRNLEIIDEMMSPDWVDHATEVMAPSDDASREGLKQMMRRSLEAFPDKHVTIDDILAEGDKVMVRYRSTGTHTGAAHRGKPPSGERVTNSIIVVDRYDEGKIVESWGVVQRLPEAAGDGGVAAPAPRTRRSPA